MTQITDLLTDLFQFWRRTKYCFSRVKDLSCMRLSSYFLLYFAYLNPLWVRATGVNPTRSYVKESESWKILRFFLTINVVYYSILTSFNWNHPCLFLLENYYFENTVEPLLSGHLLSGHPSLSGHFSKSQIISVSLSCSIRYLY